MRRVSLSHPISKDYCNQDAQKCLFTIPKTLWRWLLRRIMRQMVIKSPADAVEVLEHIASPEARHVLESLASGEPSSRITQEATAAPERIALKN